MDLSPFPKGFQSYRSLAERVFTQVLALKDRHWQLERLSPRDIYVLERPRGHFALHLKYQDRARGLPHHDDYLILEITLELGAKTGARWDLFVAGAGNDALKADIRYILHQEDNKTP